MYEKVGEISLLTYSLICNSSTGDAFGFAVPQLSVSSELIVIQISKVVEGNIHNF